MNAATLALVAVPAVLAGLAGWGLGRAHERMGWARVVVDLRADNDGLRAAQDHRSCQLAVLEARLDGTDDLDAELRALTDDGGPS